MRVYAFACSVIIIIISGIHGQLNAPLRFAVGMYEDGL